MFQGEWEFIVLLHVCSYLFNASCYGDQTPIISDSGTRCYLQTPLFSRQERNGRKTFIFKDNGLSGLHIKVASTET